MTPDAALEAVRLAGFTSVEAHALVTKSRALGLDVLDVVMAIKRPYIFDFDLGGILAPLDVTGAEASSLITEYSRRRPRTRREQLLALARVCGEVECPTIRARVCVDVLEVLS